MEAKTLVAGVSQLWISLEETRRLRGPPHLGTTRHQWWWWQVVRDIGDGFVGVLRDDFGTTQHLRCACIDDVMPELIDEGVRSSPGVQQGMKRVLHQHICGEVPIQAMAVPFLLLLCIDPGSRMCIKWKGLEFDLVPGLIVWSSIEKTCSVPLF